MAKSSYAAALLVSLLSGCSIMGHQKVEGWPPLRIVEETVADEVMLSRCSRYDPMPFACAEIFMSIGICRITLSERFAPEWVKEHERLHCAGFDHLGSTAMRDILQRYLEKKARAAL